MPASQPHTRRRIVNTRLSSKLNLIDKALSRRNFLAGAGSVAAAGVLAGCSNDGTATVATPTTPSGSFTDADVLNFALNLEYLEASFYLYAATGKGLQASDMTAGASSPYQTVGTVTTNSTVQAVPLAGNTAQAAIINEIAFEEQEHVRFLRAALGAKAVPMPNIDLTFFATLGGLLTPTAEAGFSPFASFNAFLIGSFIFEDVGVTAYLGAAPLISAAGVASGYLTAAAGILAVEAYHAAYVRTILTGSAITQGTTAFPYLGIANEVEAVRASLTVGNAGAPAAIGSTGNSGNTGATGSSASVEVQLTVPSGSASSATASSIVPCDSTRAIAFARTVDQVLHIVYGSPTVGVAKGGFFPSGVNSVFATTTA
jgi:hypothetical protein